MKDFFDIYLFMLNSIIVSIIIVIVMFFLLKELMADIDIGMIYKPSLRRWWKQTSYILLFVDAIAYKISLFIIVWMVVMGLCNCISIYNYTALSNVYEEFFGNFTVSILSAFGISFGGVKGSNRYILAILLVLLGVVLRFASDISYLNMLLSSLITFILFIICHRIKDYIKLKKKKPRLNMYTMLNYRTPKITDKQYNDEEISELCEIFYTSFMYRVQKIPNLIDIKFVDIQKDLSESKQAKMIGKVRRWSIYCVIISIVLSFFLSNFIQDFTGFIITMVLVVVLLVLLILFYKIDKNILQKYCIRMFYWGCGFVFEHKNKKGKDLFAFATPEQPLRWSKYQKSINSILDLSAFTYCFGRRKQYMKDIERNMVELVRDYRNEDDWYYFIPAYISSFFLFLETKEVCKTTGKELLKCIREYDSRERMKEFLLGIWQYTLKENDKSIGRNYVESFFIEIEKYEIIWEIN